MKMLMERHRNKMEKATPKPNNQIKKRKKRQRQVIKQY